MERGNRRCWHISILALLFLLVLAYDTQDAVPLPTTVIDHAGRSVILPQEIQNVYATTEAGTFLVYTLDPEVILGWNRGLSPDLEFAVSPAYHELPTVGTWDLHYQTIQFDVLQELQPDLIIHYSPIDQENMDLADEIEEALGRPVILVDNSIRALPDTLYFLGEILNKEVRGQALAAFAANQLGKAEQFLAVRTFYNPIPVHIVSPQPSGFFDQLLELAGMEDMPVWSDEPPFPDFVLIMPHLIADPYRAIEQDGHKRIYQIPSFPANWLDPGSLFGLLGVEWLHSVAYPNSYPGDLTETYRAFMEVFFQLDITPELLAWTLRRSGISF